jgi:pimeloyl-ACP methyl ester carboxylesterase
MGADTSIHLAARHPDLVRGVFLEDPPLLTPGEPVFGGETGRKMGDAARTMSRIMGVIKRLPAPAGRALAHRFMPAYPDSEIRPWVDAKRRASKDFLHTLAASGLEFESAGAALREVTVPVLLVIGDREEGAIVSEAVAAEAAAAVPALRVVHLAGANHDIRRARFEGYMTALEAFLEEVAQD